jgi:hypothetical protein
MHGQKNIKLYTVLSRCETGTRDHYSTFCKILSFKLRYAWCFSKYQPIWILIMEEAKQPLYSPEQALRISGCWGTQFSDNLHMNLVRLSTLRTAHFTPSPFVVLISVRGWVDNSDIVRPEGLGQWKIPTTPSGIEPATFRLVVQCFNQMRQASPQPIWK